ncbi:MAG: nuclear transport factor 2 family protein [Rhodothermaceae bacterium]|nr:nuclear transport factor 2 family protein [Rhodothermaceae bacterium]
MRFHTLLLILVGVIAITPCIAQPSAEDAITGLLQASADAWNAADLDGHVAMYRDSTSFMTGNGPVYGRSYTRDLLGRFFFRDGENIQDLRFEQITVRPLGETHALVTGRFVLSGGGEDERSGWYSLVWEWTGERWAIIHDHSS